jgi:hypothetical protein
MVELWMSEVDDAMKDALVQYTYVAMTEWNNEPDMEYLENYPGHFIYCASAINWTKSVTDTTTAGNKLSVNITILVLPLKCSKLIFG